MALIGGIVLCGNSSMVHAVEYEQEWIKSWGGGYNDIAHSIIKTSDNGYLIVGESDSYNRDAIMIKYDSNHQPIWFENWGGNGFERFKSVVETSDGGYVVVGSSFSDNLGFTNKGGLDAIIAKYNSNGTQEWLTSWGGRNADEFNDVIETSDGGFVVVGSSLTLNAAIVVKYDRDGVYQWEKKLGSYAGDEFYSLIELENEDLVVIGNTVVTQTNGNAIFPVMVVYDKEGTQKELKLFETILNKDITFGFFNDVIRTSDGGFLFLGAADYLYYDDATSSFLMKYDSTGQLSFLKGVLTDDASYGSTSVLETAKGDFIIAGTKATTQDYYGDYQAVLIGCDASGNQIWEQTLNGDGYEGFVGMVEKTDGSLVVLGSSASTDMGYENLGQYDAIIVKFSPKTDADIQINGTIQTLIADVTIPSVSPDLVIDPNSPDGVMSPEFSIVNQSNSPIKLDLKTFEQTTNTFNDVLPDKYDSWEGLNKTQSQDIALGLVAKEGDGWQQLTTPTSYVSGHTEHEIGVVKPTSQVNFEFDVHHGRAFSESKTVQYKMVFVFDLLN